MGAIERKIQEKFENCRLRFVSVAFSYLCGHRIPMLTNATKKKKKNWKIALFFFQKLVRLKFERIPCIRYTDICGTDGRRTKFDSIYMLRFSRQSSRATNGHIPDDSMLFTL